MVTLHNDGLTLVVTITQVCDTLSIAASAAIAGFACLSREPGETA